LRGIKKNSLYIKIIYTLKRFCGFSFYIEANCGGWILSLWNLAEVLFELRLDMIRTSFFKKTKTGLY